MSQQGSQAASSKLLRVPSAHLAQPRLTGDFWGTIVTSYTEAAPNLFPKSPKQRVVNVS